MALQTKTINGSTGSQWWTWKIIITENYHQENGIISTNKVDITIDEYIGRTSSAGGSYFDGSATLNFGAGGQSVSKPFSGGSSVSAGGWYKIGSHTFTVDDTGTRDNPTVISVSGSMSNAVFSPYNANANGTMSLTPLHTQPNMSVSNVEEENTTKLSGVPDKTLVTKLSKKKFTVVYELFDEATATSLQIFDQNNNELNATTNIGTTSGTIEVDFSNISLSDGVIANNKTTFNIKITDSLGGSRKILTEEYDVIPYFSPNLIPTASNVKRNGQVSGKAILNLTGLFYNATIGNTVNAISLSFAYWTGSTESTTYYSIPSSANIGSGNDITISRWEFEKNNEPVEDLDKANSYKFKIKAVDSFGSEYQSIIELTLSKGEWLMAKFKDRVDFLNVTIGNNQIIDSGSNSNGNYIKYYNGTMICTKSITGNTGQAFNLWANNIYFYDINNGDWAEEFTEIYNIQVSSSIIQMWTTIGGTTNTSAGTTRLMRPDNGGASGQTYNINVMAIGKWK